MYTNFGDYNSRLSQNIYISVILGIEKWVRKKKKLKKEVKNIKLAYYLRNNLLFFSLTRC